MTTAYWCMLIAILLPYLFTMVAKLSAGFDLRDNHNPREFLAKTTGISQRANWAQQNSFEITPAFLAAVLVAQTLGGMEQSTINALAVVFIISRLTYGLLYLADKATLRSLAWFVGIGVVIALFVGSAG